MNLLVETELSVSIIDEMKPKKILDAIQHHHVTVFHAVPPIFQLILNVPHWERYDWSSLKLVAMMGTVVPEQLMKNSASDIRISLHFKGMARPRPLPF